MKAGDLIANGERYLLVLESSESADGHPGVLRVADLDEVDWLVPEVKRVLIQDHETAVALRLAVAKAESRSILRRLRTERRLRSAHERWLRSHPA